MVQFSIFKSEISLFRVTLKVLESIENNTKKIHEQLQISFQRSTHPLLISFPNNYTAMRLIMADV